MKIMCLKCVSHSAHCSPLEIINERIVLEAKRQIEELFLSIHWVSGKYPEQLYQALLHSFIPLSAFCLHAALSIIGRDAPTNMKRKSLAKIMEEARKKEDFIHRLLGIGNNSVAKVTALSPSIWLQNCRTQARTLTSAKV